MHVCPKKKKKRFSLSVRLASVIKIARPDIGFVLRHFIFICHPIFFQENCVFYATNQDKAEK